MDSADSVVRVSAADGAEALVSLHGAQVVAWRTASGRAPLYRSATSFPASGRVVRGGVPVCFPQFGSRGSLAKHGFARTATWTEAARSQGVSCFVLRSDGTASWPHAFTLELRVSLHAEVLDLVLQATNRGTEALTFTGALHTYFAVSDIHSAALHGLQGCAYQDALDADRRKTQLEIAPAFGAEFDRVYVETPASLELEAGAGSLLRIAQEGFADTVVWNPGPDKAATLGDMPRQDWSKMLCVEAAVVDRPVTLAPGSAWTGRQRIECLPAT